MRKKFKLFSLLAIIILMSGCVKYDIGMEIGKDDSLTISAIVAVASDGSSLGSSTGEEKDALEAKGFTVEDYKTDDWTGYKYTKKYKDIDDVSTKDEVSVVLNDLLDEDKSDYKYYFQKKDSLFKTTYIANFVTELGDDINTSYMSGAELKYHVTLPSKAGDNNATSVSEDGKTLTWNLLTDKEKVNIHYEFSKTKPTFYVVIVLAIVLVIGAVLLVLKKFKKPNNMNGMNNNPFNNQQNNFFTPNQQPLDNNMNNNVNMNTNTINDFNNMNMNNNVNNTNTFNNMNMNMNNDTSMNSNINTMNDMNNINDINNINNN